jgi:hypothetical protein
MSITVATRSHPIVCGVRLFCGLQGKLCMLLAPSACLYRPPSRSCFRRFRMRRPPCHSLSNSIRRASSFADHLKRGLQRRHFRV